MQVQSGAKELQTALDHKNKDIAQCKAQLEYQCLGKTFCKFLDMPSARPSRTTSAKVSYFIHCKVQGPARVSVPN